MREGERIEGEMDEGVETRGSEGGMEKRGERERKKSRDENKNQDNHL